jgi:hypothetical protein
MSHPALPTSAYLRSGTLHYLTTIRECSVWWDDGDPGTAYLVTSPNEPEGLWYGRESGMWPLPREVADFIHNHASLSP